MHILAFLSRTSVCSNWRIISAIQQSPIITLMILCQQPSKYARSDGGEQWNETLHLIRQRVDQCCSNIHQNDI